MHIVMSYEAAIQQVMQQCQEKAVLNCLVLDVSNGFFSVPVHLDSQFWFTFTVGENNTELRQGFHNLHMLFNRAVADVLARCPGLESEGIQYVDDLLISSPDKETHMQDLGILLQHLATEG